MTALIAIGVIVAIAFALQWSTDRWWIALLVPLALIGLFAWIGSSGPNGRNAVQLSSDFLMGVPILLTICACGILPARALKNRGQNQPALHPRMLHWVAILFGIYGCYLVYVAFSFPAYSMLGGSVISFIAAIGLLRRMNWSQYLVYVLVVGFVAWWGWSAWHALDRETWKPENLDQIVLGLLPGFMFLAIAAAASTITYRSFRTRD